MGDVKILRHRETGKLRVVMRREQVFKICLNHVLTDEVVYSSKDDKSWLFVVNDFSEGTLELMQFCLRFKNHEIAEEFKSKIDEIISNDTYNDSNIPTTVATPAPPLKEKPSTSQNDEKKLISKLMLPDNFFDYITKPDCTGCRGCKSDEYVFTKIADNFNNDIIDNNPLPLEMKYKPITLSMCKL